MIYETAIRDKLIALLRNEINLVDFDSWLGRESWNMHRDSSTEAQNLVGAIELALSEYSSGHLSNAELLAELRSLVDSVIAEVFIIISPVVPSHQRRAQAHWFEVS